jgi:hypothetical protein
VSLILDSAILSVTLIFNLVLKDNNEFVIKVNGDTVLETDNGLVKQHFTKLNIIFKHCIF